MNARKVLRILVIAPLRFPICSPHAGGLESAVWSEVTALRARGHFVTVVAVRGSDFVAKDSVFEMPELEWPEDAVPTDDTYPQAYESITAPALARALDAIESRSGRYDVVSNHCLHPLPLERAPTLGVPMVTTLHTPQDHRFVSAHGAAGGRGTCFVSVSNHTRREWARAGVPSELLTNGVDPNAWPAGPGGDDLVWFGRIVPEKAPHLAVAVARQLGRPLTLAGRIGDRAYAERVLLPLVGDGVGYLGALPPAQLASLVGGSAASIATPAWAEPFGLVAPESLMCGTPFVSFAVGGVPEVAAHSIGMELVDAGDLSAMGHRVESLIQRSADDSSFRGRVRASALRRFSLDARIDALEDTFATLISRRNLIDELSA